MDKLKIKVDSKGNAEITEGADTLVGKIIAGCSGKVRLHSPLIKRKELKMVTKLPKPKETKVKKGGNKGE